MGDDGHSFQAYFKRATSPLAVLAVLRDRPMYCYELSAEMKRRSGGNYTVAVLYTVIYRLQELGFVEISSVEVVDGRARSYYRITAEGEAYLVRSLAEYDELSVAFAKLTEGIRPG